MLTDSYSASSADICQKWNFVDIGRCTDGNFSRQSSVFFSEDFPNTETLDATPNTWAA